MSASSLRYQPRPDQKHALREQIVSSAQRHRRYGAEMIHLKIRQSGQARNYFNIDISKVQRTIGSLDDSSNSPKPPNLES